jgi:hypothetical protein
LLGLNKNRDRRRTMKVSGVLIIILAIAMGIAALLFNCQAEGQSLALANGMKVPMKCFYTAMAEVAIAIPLIGVGGMLAISKRKATRRPLVIVGAILGAVIMLISTALIGVCANPAHDCNRILLPTTLFVGTLVIALSVGSLIVSERRVESLT